MKISIRKLARVLGVNPASLLKWEEKYLSVFRSNVNIGNIADRYSAESHALLFVVKKLRDYRVEDEYIFSILLEIIKHLSCDESREGGVYLLIAQIPTSSGTIYANAVNGTFDEIETSMRRLGIKYYKIYDIHEIISGLKAGKFVWNSKPDNWKEVA